MSDLAHKRLAAIEADIAEIKLQMTAMNTAFVLDDLGRPSFDSHRLYHFRQAQKAKEFDSIKLDVTKKMVQGLITAMVACMGFGVVYWLQNVMGK